MSVPVKSRVRHLATSVMIVSEIWGLIFLRESIKMHGKTHSFFEERPVPSFKSSRLSGEGSQFIMSYPKSGCDSFCKTATSISSSDIKLRIFIPPLLDS